MNADGVQDTRSRLIKPRTDIQIPASENSEETAPVAVRLYMLPIESWYDLPRKTLKNDLHVFEGHTVSFMRTIAKCTAAQSGNSQARVTGTMIGFAYKLASMED